MCSLRNTQARDYCCHAKHAFNPNQIRHAINRIFHSSNIQLGFCSGLKRNSNNRIFIFFRTDNCLWPNIFRWNEIRNPITAIIFFSGNADGTRSPSIQLFTNGDQRINGFDSCIYICLDYANIDRFNARQCTEFFFWRFQTSIFFFSSGFQYCYCCSHESAIFLLATQVNYCTDLSNQRIRYDC